MATPLRLVDGNGELKGEHCADCHAKTQAIERLTRSYEGTIRNLRDQLEDKKQAQQQMEPAVEWVVCDWCQRAHDSGWWKSRPAPTPPRMEAARLALNKGNTPGYLAMVHKGAFWNAQHRKGDRRFTRSWLEPVTLYGKFIDAYAEAATDPENERVRVMLDAPSRLFTRWARVVEMADECSCGHWRLDHGQQGDGSWPCLVHGCCCTDFDDLDVIAARWLATHEALKAKHGRVT